MYRVDGSAELVERTLDHWEGSTYGRLASRVALDRAIRMATATGLPAELTRWTTQRNDIYAQIMERGWNEERAAFAQHLGSDVLDSSLPRMPASGFIAPQDPGRPSRRRHAGLPCHLTGPGSVSLRAADGPRDRTGAVALTA
ncbi:glycoside hydrolase family 15 protein [Streptomyces sp. PSAA01]|uniref:glycoside hydrolase family 15 protein n=1 Tax=Streptomyces sp. PSAA01 TaxID=2912762 RepID=UPI001F1DFCDD|nr:glycoside hydrolase family 15 protein [Streptomyces sp. PSAA01]MCG0285504.1 hypothetical protein [Streptomyces sp. PSAA01]